MVSSIASSQWKHYYHLCKPKVVFLIVFTAVVGMLLSTETMIAWDTMIIATLGIGLAAASGAAINQLVDQHIDAIMERTAGRPIPTGNLDTKRSLIFATAIGAIAIIGLAVFINYLTALLTFISLIGYAVIYTMFLKRSTSQNIVLGGAAGATPPVLGWAAMTGEVNSEALLLFLIIFIWTPPHFWALAIRRREEYAKADIPMLPVTHGVAFTKLHILLYTIVLFAISIIPFTMDMSGLIYLAGAVVLGGGFLYHVIKLYISDTDQHAMKTFGYSIFYLSALFVFLLADHYIRIADRVFFT